MRRIAAFLFAIALTTPAHAQEWPAKPVRFIVPSSPGGGTDIYARILAQGLSEALKQQFIVDNRPGASGNIGAAAAAKSTPDGYTFLVSANPALSVNPSLYKELPYNAERDLVPVTRGVLAPMVFVVNATVPAKTLGDLVAIGKREPGKLAFASAGTGSPTYLAVRMLEENTGARYTHVPYKGVGPAYADLVGGQVQFMVPDVASAISHVRAGKLRALAVNQAMKTLPGVPSFEQAGFPLEVFTSFSVVAPAGTPAPIIKQLNAEAVKVLARDDIKSTLGAQGLTVYSSSPEQVTAHIKSEIAKFTRIARAANIKAE